MSEGFIVETLSLENNEDNVSGLFRNYFTIHCLQIQLGKKTIANPEKNIQYLVLENWVSLE